MLLLPGKIKSFWDVASPERMAEQVIRECGEEAAAFAIMESALVASADGRDEDYRYWLAVFECLRKKGLIEAQQFPSAQGTA